MKVKKTSLLFIDHYPLNQEYFYSLHLFNLKEYATRNKANTTIAQFPTRNNHYFSIIKKHKEYYKTI